MELVMHTFSRRKYLGERITPQNNNFNLKRKTSIDRNQKNVLMKLNSHVNENKSESQLKREMNHKETKKKTEERTTTLFDTTPLVHDKLYILLKSLRENYTVISIKIS